MSSKKKGRIYTKEDIDLASHLQGLASFGFINAIMYKEAAERIGGEVKR